jgi:alpha-mannosidase
MKFLAILIVLMLKLAIAGGKGINSKEFSGSENNQELQSKIQKGSILKILKVEPTVLFRNDQNRLMQAIDITVNNTGQEVEGKLKVKFRSLNELSVDIGTIKVGEGSYRFFLPEVTEVKPVEFVLLVAKRIQDRLSMSWTPRKHWEVCLVPISHHDLGYTNTIERVLQLYCEIYKDVLRFCEETENYPDEAKFRYNAEGAWSMQYFIEHSDKETLDKLAKYMKEGRIEVHALIGNISTDLCGNEELIRLMYPSFRINKEFGGQMKVGSITDVTGLSWGLPTALAGAGISYFFAGLPEYFEWDPKKYKDIVKHTFWDEKNILRPHGRPDAFYWKGPDGSKVLVYYQGTYGWWSTKSKRSIEGPKSYDQVMNELPGMLNDMDIRGNPFSVMRYAGYGCGDNTKTDIIVSNLVREWNSKWAYPKLIVSTTSMFFKKLDEQCKNSKDIRTFSGDLPQTDFSVGAISSAKETTINRMAHDKLCSAEKLATMSNVLLESIYPAKDLRDAYYNILLYDEHTWGMASPVGEVQDWAWSEKSSYAYKAAGLAEMMLSGGKGSIGGGAKTIANSIDYKTKGQHIVVFNTLSFNRNDLVNIPNFLHREPFEIIDNETGQKVPYQVLQLDSPQSPLPYAAGRFARGQFYPPEGYNLAFVADNIPSMGYKTYSIVPAESSSVSQSSLVVTDKSIENRFFKVELNPATGTVVSIFDKELGIELVDKDASHQLNQLITRWVKTGKEESPVAATIRKGKIGPVYASLVVSTSGAGCPELTQEIILYDKLRRIDISDRVLKDMTPTQEVYFAFPFRMDNPDFRFESPLSVIKPLRDQFPGSNTNHYAVQHWADVSNGKTGITFSPVEANVVEFGGLNSSEVSQAHHGVPPVTFGAPFITELKKGYMYSYIMNSNFRTNFQTTQLAEILFRYSIASHKGDWIQGRSRDFGWATSYPLLPVVVEVTNNGILPESLSFCQLDKPNVILLALKKAEYGEGTIIRLSETEGRDTEVNVTLPKIKIGKVYETNLVEENEKMLDVQEQTIKINIKAFGIKTIRIL